MLKNCDINMTMTSNILAIKYYIIHQTTRVDVDASTLYSTKNDSIHYEFHITNCTV